MAHTEQHDFIRAVKDSFPQHFADCRVLEVGSLDINGTIRIFFERCNYLGVDVGPGPGVDLIAQGEDLDLPDNSYDTVVSTECFEHNPEWVKTFKNMIRMCCSNGLVIMTCATTGRAEHGTARTSPSDSPLTQSTWGDYYKNLTQDDFEKEFNFEELFVVCNFIVDQAHSDLYFYGIKK